MENLSEDEALPNYSYQPPYNLHNLIDIASLQHYQQESQSHHSLHPNSLHTANEIQASHLTDYTNHNYPNLGHGTDYDDQNVNVYPAAMSPTTEQHLNASLGNSWQNTGLTKIGRWSETRSQSTHRVEVGGIGWTDQLNKSMHRLMEVDLLCDTVIVSNTNQIKVHKLILTSSSDYLLNLLKRYDHLKMLQLPIPLNITMEALKTFVTFLYLGKADLTSENIHEVALLANIFKIQVLKDLIIKLSGDQSLVSNENVYELQPVVMEFYDKRDQCIDTESLLYTTEQGINTDSGPIKDLGTIINNTNMCRPVDRLADDNASSTKKLTKTTTLSSPPAPHAYGTRSSLTPKGTPKSRRKTYIEEITKQDLEAKSKEVTVESYTNIAPTKEVYRGKKSRLLAGALKPESHETPKTRGKAKRKLDIANNVLTSTQEPAIPKVKPYDTACSTLNDITTSVRKTRIRKYNSDNQVPVRAPPKKRAKMALQLSIENLFEDLDNDDYNHVNDDDNHVNEDVDFNEQVEVPVVSVEEKPPEVAVTIPKKPPNSSATTKRRRTGRWKKSKNIVGIACDIDTMAESIPEADRQFKCNLCGNEFRFSKRCISHMIKTHDIEETEIIPNIIIRNKVETDAKVCNICGYKTKDQNFCYLHYHKYFKHGVPLPQGWKVYKCDECGKECFTKFMLKDHKLTHLEETPFICETCGTGFKSRTSLNSHVFHRHKEVRKHSCPCCKKTFKTKTQMSVHFRTHTGEKPFKCPRCEYKSTTRGNMRLHLTNRHKLPSLEVKNIMDYLLVVETPMEPSAVVEPPKESVSVPMQFIAVENAEIKASIQIDNQMKWTPIADVADATSLNTVAPTIILPISQSDASSTQYRTYTIVPSSTLMDGSTTTLPIDLVAPTVKTDPSCVRPLEISPSTKSSSHLYMQHSPISPAQTISPDVNFKTSHINNSPITPPAPMDSSYTSTVNVVDVSPSPSASNVAYQNYAENLSSSPISPTQTASDAYQSNNSVLMSQTLPQDNPAYSSDISQVLKIEGNCQNQNYDTTLLQVYYQNSLYSSI